MGRENGAGCAMNDEGRKAFRLKMDELVSFLDYRDPASLRWVAAEVEQTIDRIRLRNDETWKQWTYVKVKLSELVTLRDKLRSAADTLGKQIDFDLAHEGQIRDPINPEVA